MRDVFWEVSTSFLQMVKNRRSARLDGVKDYFRDNTENLLNVTNPGHSTMHTSRELLSRYLHCNNRSWITCVSQKLKFVGHGLWESDQDCLTRMWWRDR